MNGKQQVVVLKNSPQEQLRNLTLAHLKILVDCFKTALGPYPLNKMILTKIGTTEITNDGNAILRELDLSHPLISNIVDIVRAIDVKVGDGTKSTILLVYKLLENLYNNIEDIHPIRISKYLSEVKTDLLRLLKENSEKKENLPLAIENLFYIKNEEIIEEVKKILNIKNFTLDMYSYKTEKILSQQFSIQTLYGVILNKNIYHPQMRKNIENPKILISDQPLEYKKADSQTDLKLKKSQDFDRALEIEVEDIDEKLDEIFKHDIDIFMSEKGVCDYALHKLHEKNITVIRRLNKGESTRAARATGATIIGDYFNISKKDIGQSGRFEFKKIADEYYCIFDKCENPQSVSIMITGPSKELLNKIERSFIKTLKNFFNFKKCNRIVPGGGKIEKILSDELFKIKKENFELEKIYKAVSNTLTIIPNILNNKNINKDFVDIYAVKKEIYMSVIEAVQIIIRVDGILKSKKIN